jgi:hypothetical protein
MKGRNNTDYRVPVFKPKVPDTNRQEYDVKYVDKQSKSRRNVVTMQSESAPSIKPTRKQGTELEASDKSIPDVTFDFI